VHENTLSKEAGFKVIHLANLGCDTFFSCQKFKR